MYVYMHICLGTSMDAITEANTEDKFVTHLPCYRVTN